MFNSKFNIFKKNSYSQSGEDLILHFICNNLLQISKPSYLDIGAFHPFKFNNFQIFYDSGSRGINIEPNPVNFKLFQKYRKNDLNLNFGIGIINSEITYYSMQVPELNTFCKEEAYKRKEIIVSEKQVPVKTFNTIIQDYCNSIVPDIVSIDVEGFDEIIIKSIDFEKYKPLVFCIETIVFSGENEWVKNNNIKKYLISNGYIHHSDTMINSIFILESALKNIVIK